MPPSHFCKVGLDDFQYFEFKGGFEGQNSTPSRPEERVRPEPGDSVSVKRTRGGLIVMPSKKADYVSRFRELIETPPSRLGRPQNWKPSKMKSVWKTA